MSHPLGIQANLIQESVYYNARLTNDPTNPVLLLLSDCIDDLTWSPRLQAQLLEEVK